MASPDVSLYGGKGPLLVAISWFCFTIGDALAILRIFVIFLLPYEAKYPLDLWPLLVATVFAIASQPCLILAAHNGVGNDAIDADPERVAKATYWLWCYVSLAIFSTVFTQLANIALLRQLQDKTKPLARRIVSALGVFPVCFGIATVIVVWTRCDPATGTMEGASTDSCSMDKPLLILLIAQGAFTAFFDFVLGGYTLLTYRKFKLPNHQHLKLLLFYASSFSSGVLAIVRSLQMRPLLDNPTAIGAASPLMIWLHIEQWLAICIFICPRLRTLVIPLRHWKHDRIELVDTAKAEEQTSSITTPEDRPEVPPANESQLPQTVRRRIERMLLYQQMIMSRRSLQIEVSHDVRVEYHEPRPIDTASETWLLDHDEDFRAVHDGHIRHNTAVPIRELPRMETPHSQDSKGSDDGKEVHAR
ncbi:hypothetical protein K461DRAFT_280338 [Myriangium duriaei CBS 260.36]|uniref:Rhodopsin domain-containing protein n=1 Tax=Myriangium duriaei CBS 260.36 TaxID=1168546 RepID=A0A9P4IWU4_9PEZI|nr:hypothetical protein K461DRAFT_280338 [Myriangium duriaei CBS 260.36]